MTNALNFYMRLKSVNKAGTGLPAKQLRGALLAEYLGPAMHAKLHQAHRARRRRGGSLEL